ncbi:unnamed protein product [Anisakis simplex]|uniref:RNA-binding protein 4F (inferred by orthology to a D. melanogaster protein) n=1 Tax=Anisakis simplex TaxID=6269 RepID=A0A0M3KII4_ANISI|nr:unnamed protein product [Anisakis simplex]
MELITLLRGAGELEALRTQRESTSRRFAMPPKFWMEWIDDEKTCESERDLIESIFDRAIKDFHSPDVIIEYVQWACGVSIEFARKKMDEAIGLIGCRADCASTIWNIYLDFEKMILRSLSGEQAEKHHLLIDGIYARFLRIPHLGLEETWSDYQAFTGSDV